MERPPKPVDCGEGEVLSKRVWRKGDCCAVISPVQLLLHALRHQVTEYSSRLSVRILLGAPERMKLRTGLLSFAAAHKRHRRPVRHVLPNDRSEAGSRRADANRAEWPRRGQRRVTHLSHGGATWQRAANDAIRPKMYGFSISRRATWSLLRRKVWC